MSTVRLRGSLRAGLCVALGLASVALGACGASAEEQEAERLLVAIERLRAAPASPTEDRTPLVDALAAASATTPAALAARDACVRAYRALEEANGAERRARKALDIVAQGGLLGAEVLTDVALAESRLAESRDAMPTCEAAQSALRRGKSK